MKITRILLSVVVIVVSSIMGLSLTVCADNVADSEFVFFNTSGSVYTSSRYKNTPSDVYVRLVNGLPLLCTVQGYNGIWNNRSEAMYLIAGTQVNIPNSVYQNGEELVRLHLERTVFSYSYSQGMWNPDPLPEGNNFIYG